MANIIQCDLHDEPIAADFLVTNINNGDVLGVCPGHLITFADEMREAMTAMAEAGPPPTDDDTDAPPPDDAEANRTEAEAAGVLAPTS